MITTKTRLAGFIFALSIPSTGLYCIVFYLVLIVQYNLLKAVKLLLSAVKLLNIFIKIKPSLSIPLSGVK
jgi:hypothetical protein